MTTIAPRLRANPAFQGQGEQRTQIDGTIKMLGTPAAFSGGYLSDLQFIGSHGTKAALELQGACDVRWDRIRFDGTFSIGILFHNSAASDFTEMSAGQAHFSATVTTPVEYRVTSGNASFHGSGLTDGSTINQSSSATGPVVKIGAGAEPYNAPLSVILWARTAQPLIRHDGERSSGFYGDMKIELLPSNAKAVVCDPAGSVDLSYVGSVSRRGKFVSLGRLVVGDETVIEGAFTRTRRGGAEVASRVAGSVMVVGPDGNAEWVPTTRTNRAKNPVAGDGTTNASGYNGATVASATDSALGSTKLFTVTTNDTAQTQGFIYLQTASDLAQGQVKTIAFDVLSPVDIILYAGGRFGHSGAPGVTEHGQYGASGDIEYIAANVVRRVRRTVTVPAPNTALTHEGLYFRANTTADMPANGTVIKVGNITIEDGTTAGSKFSGESGGQWTGTAHQSTSLAYPSKPTIAEVAYTPTLTNITLGNGILAAYYSRDGKRVSGSIYFKMGSTSAVSGLMRFSLPVDAPAVAGSQRRFRINGWMNDFSITQRFIATGLPFGTTALDVHGVGGGAGGWHIQLETSATAPFTWAVDDEMLVSFEYESA